MISIVSKTVLYLWCYHSKSVAGVPVILVVYPVEGIEISLIVFYVFWKGCGYRFIFVFYIIKGQFVGLDYCKPTADFEAIPVAVITIGFALLEKFIFCISFN
jgi:hypothetical protein